jgi:hypothetical protein
MGRARGKHNDRKPVVTPDSGEGREIGMSDRMAEGGPEGKDKSPIPGGISHLGNAPTVRQHAAVPDQAPREYEGIMAHGVPPSDHTTTERAEAERGPNTAHDPQPKYLAAPKKPAAVPVQIVQTRKIQTVATASYTIPAQGSAAVRIAGRDYTRTRILLLVETAAGAAGAAPTGIRFDHEVSELDVNKGALLRAGAVSYLKLECNDELFAVSNDGSACTLSVIYLYGIAESS